MNAGVVALAADHPFGTAAFIVAGLVHVPVLETVTGIVTDKPAVPVTEAGEDIE